MTASTEQSHNDYMAMNGNTQAREPITGFLTPTRNYNLTGFTAERKSQLLEVLTIKYNISAACKEIGIDQQTYYLAMRMDPVFKQAVDNVREAHLDRLEQSMFEYGNTARGTADRIFALKSWRRERYGERTTIQHQSKTDLDKVFSRLVDEGRAIEIEAPESASGDVGVTPQ